MRKASLVEVYLCGKARIIKAVSLTAQQQAARIQDIRDEAARASQQATKCQADITIHFTPQQLLQFGRIADCAVAGAPRPLNVNPPKYLVG